MLDDSEVDGADARLLCALAGEDPPGEGLDRRQRQ